jgi:hypothetical protein
MSICQALMAQQAHVVCKAKRVPLVQVQPVFRVQQARKVQQVLRVLRV